jgi:hypothetical protein
MYSNVGLIEAGIFSEIHLPYAKKSLISIIQRIIAIPHIAYLIYSIYGNIAIVENSKLCIKYIIQ